MSARERMEGSVVFSDLVGFTEFNDARGDQAAVDVLDEHRAVMDAAIEPVEGARVVKELGDGLLVWSPSAMGGLVVATGFVSGLAEARRATGFPLAVRVGLHYGEVSPRGDDIVGQTVNIAARIVDLAGPSEILMSDSVFSECRGLDGVSCDAVGPVSVKGVNDAVWLYRIATVVDHAC